MSTTYINAQLRRHVVRRADQLCEYCLIHDDDTYWGCQIDRLIERQELQALGRYPMKEALALIEG